MAQIAREVTLNITKRTEYSLFEIPQGDIIDRVFYIRLINGTDDYIVPTTAVAVFSMDRFNTDPIVNSCQITSDGRLILTITEKISSIDGRFPCAFTITDSTTGGTLSSFATSVVIVKNPNVAEITMQQGEYTLLTDALLRVGDVSSHVEAAKQATADAIAATDTINALESALKVWEEYNNTKAYVVGNKVTYLGSLYVCTVNSTSNLPTDTTHWLKIASKGDTGNDGISSTVAVNTNTSTTYKLDITDKNGTITTPNLRGVDGAGGDMYKNVYDTQGKATDIFQYVGDKTQLTTTANTDLVVSINEINSNKVAKGELLINVKDYGAKGDGTTDDTTAIINAVSSCADKGGGTVYFPPTTSSYIITSTITLGNGTTTSFSTMNGIKCRGGSVYSTRIKWNGSSDGTMFKIAGISSGNSLGEMTLDGNNTADFGCDIVSGQYSQWGDLKIINCSKTLRLTTLSSVPNGWTSNTIGNVFGKLFLIPSTGTSTNQSYGLVLDGANTSGDSNNNYFPNIHIAAQTNYITAVRLGFADFNEFGNVICFSASNLTGCYGLHLDGTVVSGFPDANKFGNVAFAQQYLQTGTPGINSVNLYGTLDGMISIPSGGALYGLAQNPKGTGINYPPVPFGNGSPVNLQSSCIEKLITSITPINVIEVPSAQDGLYQVNLYFRVTTSTTNVTAMLFASDVTNTQYAYLQAQQTKTSNLTNISLTNATLTPESYTCVPYTFVYKTGTSQPPVLQITVDKINQVYISASIIKVG